MTAHLTFDQSAQLRSAWVKACEPSPQIPIDKTGAVDVPVDGAGGERASILTIDREYSRMYVDGVAKRYQSSALLLAAYRKSIARSGYRETPYGDALFDGYRAIFHDLNDWVKDAQRHGVLLHLVPA